MTSQKFLKTFILFFSLINLSNFSTLTNECIASEPKARPFEVYQKASVGKKQVMIIGGGHRFTHIPYSENFYLVDSNRSFNVDPDLQLDITASSPPSYLSNQFDVVVFEYVAVDALTLQSFRNSHNF